MEVVSVPKLISARFSSGRVSMPVRPSQYMYARFKHVNGVPSPAESGGLSIAKLKSIDVLIDRLKQIKGEGSQLTMIRDDLSDSGALDALINELSAELHSAALTSSPLSGAGKTLGSALQGLVVDFTL